MAKIYARLILNGSMTLEDVPTRWRADVEALLGIDADGEP